MKTTDLEVGTEIIVETGYVQLGNIKFSKQTVKEIKKRSNYKDNIEQFYVYFESGLICLFGSNSEHDVQEN